MQETNDLLSRVERLEKGFRNAKRWRNFFLAGMGCLLVLAWQAPNPRPAKGQTIEARGIRLVDEQGRRRAELGSDPETPRATSLCLYDWPRDEQEVLVGRFMAIDGGAAFDLTGDANHGAIWMSNDKKGASVNLLTCCAHASHGNPDGVKVGVAELRADPDGGQISLNGHEEVTIQGEHAHRGQTFFQRAPSKHVDEAGK